MFGRFFQKNKKADNRRITEEEPEVVEEGAQATAEASPTTEKSSWTAAEISQPVEETPQVTEKNYRIEVVQEGQAKLRKNAVKFLNEHGFEKLDFTAKKKKENQQYLKDFGVENAHLLTEELIVALAPDSYEIYGVAHLSSPGAMIEGLLNFGGEPHILRRHRIEVSLKRILLSKLAVDPEHGGQGIGHALVEKAIEVARDGGYEVICGQIDDEVGDNDKLTEFYRDCGFTVDLPGKHPSEMLGFPDFPAYSPYKGNEFFLKL